MQTSNKNNIALTGITSDLIRNLKGKNLSEKEISLKFPDGVVYKLESELGTGGNGKVFSAKNENTNEDVVIKLCFSENNKDEQETTKNLGLLLNAGTILDESGNPVLACMALPHLGQELFANLPKEESDLYDLAIKVCLAVHDLHTGKTSKTGEKYAHLDLKPENILIDSNQNIRIIDFDTAKTALNEDYAWGHSGSKIYQPKNNSRLTNQHMDILALMRILYIPETFYSSDLSYYDTQGLTNRDYNSDTYNDNGEKNTEIKKRDYLLQSLETSEKAQTLLDTHNVQDDQLLNKDGGARDFPSALDLAAQLALLKNNISLQTSNFSKFLDEKKEIISALSLGKTELCINHLQNEKSLHSLFIRHTLNDAIASIPNPTGTNKEKLRLANVVLKKDSLTNTDLLQVMRILSHRDYRFVPRVLGNVPESYTKVQPQLVRAAKLLNVSEEDLKKTQYGKNPPSGVSTYQIFQLDNNVKSFFSSFTDGVISCLSRIASCFNFFGKRKGHQTVPTTDLDLNNIGQGNELDSPTSVTAASFN